MRPREKHHKSIDAFLRACFYALAAPLSRLACPRWTLAYGMYSIHHVDTEITRSSGGYNETSERVMFVSGFLRGVMDLERYSYATNE